MTPEEVAEVMANHHGVPGLECFGDEYDCPYYWPCPTYRVAEALVAERAKVARVETYANELYGGIGDIAQTWPTACALGIRRALADQPKP